jgi:membrane-associated phospholipid phosphatase
MTAFGTCALLILWESGRPRSIGLIDVLLAVAPLTIVSVALILTGYHYVTDLAGGTALGLGTTCGIALLFGARNLGDPPRQEPMGPSAGVTHDTLSP